MKHTMIDEQSFDSSYDEYGNIIDSTDPDYFKNKRKAPFAAAAARTLKNGWFYMVCVCAAGIFIRLPVALYLPNQLAVFAAIAAVIVICFAAFLLKEFSYVRKHTVNGVYIPEKLSKISSEDFISALGYVLTKKISYIAWAICAVPPYWLANHFFFRTPYRYAASAAVLIAWFAAFFSMLAVNRARKMKSKQ